MRIREKESDSHYLVLPSFHLKNQVVITEFCTVRIQFYQVLELGHCKSDYL